MARLLPDLCSFEVKIPLLNETVRLSEMFGYIPSITVAVVWYFHRRTYWLLQDVIGIALCFLFLRTVQLPNLKVATLLLTLAFCYDVIFCVSITHLLWLECDGRRCNWWT